MSKKVTGILISFTLTHIKVLLKFLYDNRANIRPDGSEDREMIEIIKKFQDKLEEKTGRWWV